jgi:hypothetical protein
VVGGTKVAVDDDEPDSSDWAQNVSCAIRVSAGNGIQCIIWQNSGGNLNIRPNTY